MPVAGLRTDRFWWELLKKWGSAFDSEGVLTTIRPIACLDTGFGHSVLWDVPRDVPQKALNEASSGDCCLHGFDAATELSTSSQRPVWCGRLSC